MAQQPATVQGNIRDKTGVALSHLLVQAFNVGLESDVLLAETISGKDGSYRIEYIGENINLRIKVLDSRGELLAESGISFKPGPQTTIDVQVTAPVGLTEYEQLLTVINHFAGDSSFVNWTERETGFVLEKLKADQREIPVNPDENKLHYLVQGSVLAVQSGLPPEFFYGIAVAAGMKPPLSLKDFTAMEEKTINKLLATAVKRKIIPDLSSLPISQMLEDAAVASTSKKNKKAAFRLMQEGSTRPLEKYYIQATLLDNNTDLGKELTNNRGIVVFNYRSRPGEQSRLSLQVTDFTGTLIKEIIVTRDDSNTVMDIEVILPALPDPSPGIIALSQLLQIEIPAGVPEVLREAGILTLDDLRRRGGFKEIANLPIAPDHPSLARIDAHADLLTLAGYKPEDVDPAIRRGFTNITRMAAADRPTFVGGSADDIGHFKATSLLKQATVSAAVLRNMMTNIRVNSTSRSAEDDQSLATIENIFDNCGCCSCETAASPVAYLQNLLDYAIGHVKNDDSPITIDFLNQIFFRPFDILPASCGETGKEIRQVQLCIEVLKRYLLDKNIPVPGSPEADVLTAESRQYLELCYTNMLGLAGTSFEELREVLLLGDDRKKEKLALRLGIPVDKLNKLFLDLSALSNDEIEHELEHLFGFPDTSRDFLSEGAKLNDSNNQLLRWNFQGKKWDTNTDEDGYIYLKLLQPAPDIFRAEVYRNIERTEMVASGETNTANGIITLVPVTNGTEPNIISTGIHGEIHVEFTTADEHIRISLFPLMLSLRYQHASAIWATIDDPLKPVIDPDIVALENLVLPFDENPAFIVWKERELLLSQRYQTLINLEVGSSDPDRWNALLTATGTTVPGDELLAAELRYMENIAEHINSSSPTRLIDLEWKNIVSVLLNVEKRRLFTTWRQQETDNKIILDSRFFKPGLPGTARLEQLTEWRANPELAAEFNRLLGGREDEIRRVGEEFEKIADAAADNNMTRLRNSLVNASDAEGDDLNAKAIWLGDRLFINTLMEGHIVITRIANAIESLQGMLFSIRSGQLEDTHPTLELFSDDFDEEWKWLGSYETWRAAMMVFLFPENVLDPSLRRNRTGAFNQITEALRSAVQLSPKQACTEGRKFTKYISDVANLKIEATCQARVAFFHDSCLQQQSFGSTTLNFLFGRAAGTGNVYYSTYGTRPDTGFMQTFWEPVPMLGEVMNIIGAAIYEYNSDRTYRFIFLFARKKIGLVEKLVFVRYDLEAQRFEGIDPYVLELPGGATAFTAVINQENDSKKPPALCLQINGSVFINRLNFEGNAFDETVAGLGGLAFQEYASPSPLALVAMVSFDSNPGFSYVLPQYFVLIGARSGKIFFKFFKPANRSSPTSTYGATNLLQLSNGEWLGSSFWPSGPDLVYTFYRQNNTVKYKVLFYDTDLDRLVAEPEDPAGSIGTFVALNDVERFAVHNAANEADSLYHQLAFQLRGPNPGPFLGVFSRLPRPFDDIFTPVTDVVIMARSTSGDNSENGRSGMVMMMDNGVGPVVGMDIDILDPGGNWPPPPPPPEDPTVPGQLPITQFNRIRLAPLLRGTIQLIQKISEDDLQTRKGRIRAAFLENSDSTLAYLEELFYFVPVLIALNLQRGGHYMDALDWFRTVYDYSQPRERRKIYYGLEKEESSPLNYDRFSEWLLEPMNPHAIAATRQNTYTRYTLLSLVKCLLNFADSEFSKDTSETIARAYTLYTTAKQLLNEPELTTRIDGCETLIHEVEGEADSLPLSVGPLVKPQWAIIAEGLTKLRDKLTRREVADQLKSIISTQGTALDNLVKGSHLINQHVYQQGADPDMGRNREAAFNANENGQKLLMRRQDVADTVGISSFAALKDMNNTFTRFTGHTVDRLETFALPWLAAPKTNTRFENPEVINDGEKVTGHFQLLNLVAKADPLTVMQENQSFTHIFFISPESTFCIPANPRIEFLLLHVDVSIEKINSGRNIAGLERPLPPYSTTVCVKDGIPFPNRNGELIIPENQLWLPTIYRFQTLIDRAKQLVGLAQQLEATFLSILEKRDAEYYNLVKARQDINLSIAGVRLRQLSMEEAKSAIKLADMQVARANIQRRYYADLLGNSVSSDLDTVLGYAIGGGTLAVGIATSNPALIVQGATSLIGSIFGGNSNEEREQQIEYAYSLANQDKAISEQQKRQANDRLRSVGQELVIANMQAGHARETMDYLVNKFTNAQLYDWMSQVLEEIYSTFLQQACAVAQMAGYQLAFERQEAIPQFIQSDYWEAPLGSNQSDNLGAGNVDRKGLTGSARLLRDIFQLDQFAFDTDQRRLELTRTISLSRMAPAEFQRFRNSGVMPFQTTLDLFDRDFPGHYLRLIRRLRVSIIALIPPTEGIKATLTANGISRVIVGGETFRQTIIRRAPETVALTVPINSTGRFEFELKPNEGLRPFEGHGLEMDWVFELPKASNQFNYDTIADVQLTIDYVALSSDVYRRTIIQSLGRKQSIDRAYSFRHELADQWFDLNNPEQTSTPMVVSFDTKETHFLPNLDALSIQHVVLFFLREDGLTFEVDVTHLLFTEQGSTTPVGGAAASSDGIISTRRGNAANWLPMRGKSPIGHWELALTDSAELRDRFKNEEITEILFVITYSAMTPEWT